MYKGNTVRCDRDLILCTIKYKVIVCQSYLRLCANLAWRIFIPCSLTRSLYLFIFVKLKTAVEKEHVHMNRNGHFINFCTDNDNGIILIECVLSEGSNEGRATQ